MNNVSLRCLQYQIEKISSFLLSENHSFKKIQKTIHIIFCPFFSFKLTVYAEPQTINATRTKIGIIEW